MDYRSIIESRYNRQSWQELLYDIFRQKVQFWQQPQLVPVDESMAKRALFTGKITLPDGHIIAIYEVELSDSVIIERNRAGIRNLLCTNWRGMGCSGAFMFCFRQNEAVLRFSYVSEAFTFTEDGGIKKESTDTKRFTYLLGEGHRSRTAIQQFEKLKASGLTLKDVTKAFSVEALSKMFFDEYKKQYEDIIEFITGKRMVKVANKWEERVTGQPCSEIMQEFAKFEDAEKAVRDYVKKLMGRLVFIQFLQKKGWMGCSAGELWNDGDREFVQNLFVNTQHKNTFVDDVLERLFNDLNTKRYGDLVTNQNIGRNVKVPYLNGGLFENDDYDSTKFPLPAKYMKSMLDFFASYNFTIDENDPNDAEIGVDPEMLGRIFENLLEDNKDKGAFYTPKEIVQYMCRESLIAYLTTCVLKKQGENHKPENEIRDAVRRLLAEPEAIVPKMSKEHLEDFDRYIREVKICDPAIGSGAFPMGLLNELVRCRVTINAWAKDAYGNILIGDYAALKADIICNNIYGVDIEKGAVDIARLRFWLALIVDEKTPHALPNMDFKIMQGNSLLEQYEGVVLSGMSLNEQKEKKEKKGDAYQTSFAFDEKIALENIQKAIKQYYLTDNHESKLILRKTIDDNVKSYILNFKGCTPDIQRKLENLPIPNDKFFLWHIYFKEVFDKGGFDIVIGNPPYVSYYSNTGQTLKEEEREVYLKIFDVIKKKDDRINLMNLMLENGIKLLRSGGHLSFITNKTTAVLPSYLSTREFVLNNCDFVYYVPNLSPFEAIVDCIIIGLNRCKSNDEYLLWSDDLRECSIKSTSYFTNNRLKEFVISKDAEIIGVIDSHKAKLSDFININRGVNIGGCFEQFLSKEKRTEEYRRYLPGTANVKRFAYNWKESDGFMKLDVNLEKELRSQGKTIALGNPERYDTERIIIPESSQVITAAYCKDAYYTGYGLMIATIKDKNINLQFLCALLNSDLITFYCIEKGILRKGNKATPHVGTKGLLSIPVPVVSKSIQAEIADIAIAIKEVKERCEKEKITYYCSKLNALVFEIYGVKENAKIINEYIQANKLDVI